jgi:hypothetical protein
MQLRVLRWIIHEPDKGVYKRRQEGQSPGSIQKLELARNGFSPKEPRRNTAVPTSLRLLTSRTVR